MGYEAKRYFPTAERPKLIFYVKGKMTDIFLTEINKLSLILSITTMFILNAVFSFFWPQIHANIRFFKPYKAVQKVHEGEVSRLGGLISYLGLMIYWLLCHDSISMPFIEAILLSIIPLLLISVKEDLFYNTTATQRLVGMFLTSLLFFNLYPVIYPLLEIPLIGEVINQNPPLNLIFFIFATLVIMNGNNPIDGQRADADDCHHANYESIFPCL